jgi:hypothetical protein
MRTIGAIASITHIAFARGRRPDVIGTGGIGVAPTVVGCTLIDVRAGGLCAHIVAARVIRTVTTVAIVGIAFVHIGAVGAIPLITTVAFAAGRIARIRSIGASGIGVTPAVIRVTFVHIHAFAIGENSARLGTHHANRRAIAHHAVSHATAGIWGAQGFTLIMIVGHISRIATHRFAFASIKKH